MAEGDERRERAAETVEFATKGHGQQRHEFPAGLEPGSASNGAGRGPTGLAVGSSSPAAADRAGTATCSNAGPSARIRAARSCGSGSGSSGPGMAERLMP